MKPRPAFGPLLLGALLLVGTAASADVKTPSGKTIPDPALSCYGGQPGGLAVIFSCICTAPGLCNLGKPCPGGSTSCDPGTNGTCEATVWHAANDDPCIPTQRSGLDPVKDAWLKPETFRPVCGLKFTLVTRGGAMFKNAFGWYNVDPGGKAPDPGDLHPLVDCSTPNNTTASLNVLGEPAYKGGEVGFFIATPESHTQKGACAGGDCCGSVARAQKGEGYLYYSQPKLNPDSGAGDAIHLLVYSSKLEPFKYYFAWEDTFNGLTTDFGDFVTSVSGVACAGGGVPCDTGKPGLCSKGMTLCQDDGKLVCEPGNKPATEACDGIDNDCDGKIDNGAACDAGKQCFQGVCVGSCKTSQEFACNAGYECDPTLGLCLDSKCKDTVCKADEICRQGLCANGCAGVVCPHAQVCQSGLCVDLCAGRTCAAGELCKLGVCLPSCLGCGGITCTGGLSCHPKTGDCYDASCQPECAPGNICQKGKCLGPCDGVVCPGGVACVNGTCPPPAIGVGKPAGDGGQPPRTDDAGRTIRPDGGSGAGGFTGDSGCSCRVGEPPSSLLGCALMLALLLARRRR